MSASHKLRSAVAALVEHLDGRSPLRASKVQALIQSKHLEPYTGAAYRGLSVSVRARNALHTKKSARSSRVESWTTKLSEARKKATQYTHYPETPHGAVIETHGRLLKVTRKGYADAGARHAREREVIHIGAPKVRKIHDVVIPQGYAMVFGKLRKITAGKKAGR